MAVDGPVTNFKPFEDFSEGNFPDGTYPVLRFSRENMIFIYNGLGEFVLERKESE